MGCIDNGKICIIGNFAKVTKKRPKNWYDKDYKIIIPWEEKFKDFERPKLGKATCDCKEVLECHQPYYGFNWYHSNECAIVKHLKKYPQIYYLIGDYDPTLVAYSC